MTTASQSAVAPAKAEAARENIDPIFRQIRDLVYKTSGIYHFPGAIGYWKPSLKSGKL